MQYRERQDRPVQFGNPAFQQYDVFSRPKHDGSIAVRYGEIRQCKDRNSRSLRE